MHAIRAASTALWGAAILALAAPVALADGAPAPVPRAPGAQVRGDFLVSPGVVDPGGRVTLSAPGCASTATATSGIFDTVTLAPGSAATATVDRDARPGAVYTVAFNCTGGIQGTVDLTITGTSTTTPTISSTILAPPRGVRGGLGGSVGEGVDRAGLATGGTLVLAAMGGALALRRRSARTRRH
ncbi:MULTISPECIES: hypothetical protein [unclassified Streptomyces]|uniref:hypothetical protein n=1 Tax=unclassified Streptomyces TaxID=2593676 RepID=UPI0016615EC0|nr:MULTISPECIES: hypothetical protein [unclassified Streptomyces]MBD0707088.1 hypothetical protein [Streptomyces sp. CBMA291]MBD0714275.1 hypothetical protein [Streptomyces sp. CBMA370]